MVAASPLQESSSITESAVPTSLAKRKLEDVDDHASSSASVNGEDGPETSAAAMRRATDSMTAKAGVIVPSSGDGNDCGDECFMWTDLPMNKQGFRYLPCGPSPNISPSPLHPFYRTVPYCPPTPLVHLSWLDRSPFLRLSQSATTCTTDKGFRSARANISARQGAYYFECKVLRSDTTANAHVRVGWARREASLNGPVGFDAYSYGIRDVTGEKVSISRPRPYGRSFTSGDVVGCLISLPEREFQVQDQRIRKPFRYKGQLYHEMTEYTASREMEALIDREGKGLIPSVTPTLDTTPVKPPKPSGSTTKNVPKARGKKDAIPAGPINRPLPTLPDSFVSFFINGQPLGKAFTDLYDFLPLPPAPPVKGAKRPSATDTKENTSDDGTLGYYPMVSCFGRGKVECNFGPDWLAPVADGDWGLGEGVKPSPMSARWEQFQAEEAIRDERDEASLAIQIKAEMERIAKEGLGIANGKTAKGKKGGARPKKQIKRSLLVVEERGTPQGTPGPDDASSIHGTPTPYGHLSRDYRASSETTSVGVRPSSPIMPDASMAGDHPMLEDEEMDAEGEEVDMDGMDVD